MLSIFMFQFNPMVKLSFLTLLLLSCNQPVLKKVFAFPKSLKENSGIEVTSKSKLIWTLQDSGNPAELHGVDVNGKIVQTIQITNAKNHDWEDLTSDDLGNLYIGDFGNNNNDRKDLAIYKVDAGALKSKQAAASSKINFYFPEQKDFPPKKSQKFFDLEAFFYYKDNFYLFTKNRSSKFNGETTLYQVPNKPGNHAAKRIGKFTTCDRFGHCAVTSADISPDGKTVALLSPGFVWLFTNYSGTNFFGGKVQQIDLEDFSQKEGLCFSGNKKLLICDEREKMSGGNLYEIDLTERVN
jgi:sugar lactone lactonase YvrE